MLWDSAISISPFVLHSHCIYYFSLDHLFEFDWIWMALVNNFPKQKVYAFRGHFMLCCCIFRLFVWKELYFPKQRVSSPRVLYNRSEVVFSVSRMTDLHLPLALQIVCLFLKFSSLENFLILFLCLLFFVLI